MTHTAFAIPLAYPDTVVMISEEWYVKHLYYLGIGKKNYVKAGHAALVLIEKETGYIEYFDFGRYITPQPYGRVRSELTDHELIIPFKAEIEHGVLKNKDAIFKFFATQRKLTHGEGRLITTVCDEVDYSKAKSYIAGLQKQSLIKYGVFKKKATNCARFVTDALLHSIVNKAMLKNLNATKLFTPSPIGNVLAVKNRGEAYQVSESGAISVFKNTKQKEILKCFLDRMPNHISTLKGNLESKSIEGLSSKAQWLAGIGAGAWFELFKTDIEHNYLFKRTSSFGTVDTETVFTVDNSNFNSDVYFEFTYNTNCNKLEVLQNKTIFNFNKSVSLSQKERSA